MMVCVVVEVRQLLALAVVGRGLRARERVDFLSPGMTKGRPTRGKGCVPAVGPAQ
jgi:hypothetical protein